MGCRVIEGRVNGFYCMYNIFEILIYRCFKLFWSAQTLYTNLFKNLFAIKLSILLLVAHLFVLFSNLILGKK